MRIFYLLSAIIFSFIFYSSTSSPNRAEAIFFDVGQGDSFALRTPKGKIILVDGGPDWSALYHLGRWLGFDKKIIDILVISHGHADHLTALPEIAVRYDINQIFLPSSLTGFASADLLTNLAASGREVKYPRQNLCRELEPDCLFCLFPPPESFLEKKDENDLSLAIYFDCAGLSLAAFGDAGKEREKFFLNSGLLKAVQIFKASHHGSNSANSFAFLRALRPQITVISVGADNTYGHPNETVIKRLGQLSSRIWRTDQAGSLIFYSNNSHINFKRLD